MGLYGQKNMGIPSDGDHSENETGLVEGEEEAPSNIESGSVIDKDAPKEEQATSPEPPQTTNILSLDDMEAMLVDADTKDDDDAGDVAPTHLISKHDAGNCVDGCEDTSLFIQPWTLCEKWDACAIGTMPGYPS